MCWHEKLSETHKGLRNLNGAMPETAQAFGGLGKAVKQGGVSDFKTKEFVALGIAVSDGCEPCIGLHIETLVKAQATRAEISDVLGMCIQMGGDPSMMYAAKALDCYDELTSQPESS